MMTRAQCGNLGLCLCVLYSIMHVYIATNPFKFLPFACVAWHCMAWLVGVVCTVTDVSYQTRYRIGLNNFCACILNYSARALFMEIMHACVCVCV